MQLFTFNDFLLLIAFRIKSHSRHYSESFQRPTRMVPNVGTKYRAVH